MLVASASNLKQFGKTAWTLMTQDPEKIVPWTAANHLLPRLRKTEFAQAMTMENVLPAETAPPSTNGFRAALMHLCLERWES